MTPRVTFALSEHPDYFIDDDGNCQRWADDGYYFGDWFREGAYGAALNAETAQEADAILRANYLGPDTDGIEVKWTIR